MKKEKKFIRTVARQYPPLLLALFVQGYSQEKYVRGLFDAPLLVTDIVAVDGEYWYEEGNLDHMRSILDGACTREAYELIRSEFLMREIEFIAATKKDWKDFSYQYERYSPAISIFWLWDVPIMNRLEDQLLRHISCLEMDALLDVLNIPLEDNYYKREQYDLMQTENLEAHVQEYEWVRSRYGQIDPYTLEQAKQNRIVLESEGYIRKYKKEKENVRGCIKRAKEIIGKEYTHLVDLMQYIIYYRTQRTDLINKAIYLYIPKLQEMAMKYSISYEELLHCLPEEVSTGSIPDQKILHLRIQDHALVFDNGKIQCFIGQDLKDIKEEFHENVEDVTELSGTVASPGKVEGKVIVIKGKDDFQKVEDGDIIVTNMTTPDMMPILRKAGAFVTEEGGITCHAAIVSRELKKPCIIGTKIATKVLKDGDMIEVDAEKGLVNLIHRT